MSLNSLNIIDKQTYTDTACVLKITFHDWQSTENNHDERYKISVINTGLHNSKVIDCTVTHF